MADYTFAGLVNPIPAKKVVWMQQCFGGNFADDITGANTYFLSAGSQGESTHPAEDICPANYKNERYYVGSTLVDTCNHGEFNFHMYSSQNGVAPSGSLFHGHPTSCPNIYYLFADIDINADGYIDHDETFDWLINAEATQETPLLDDPYKLSAFTSFEYPTLLHDELPQTMDCRGLIGISNDTYVTSGSTLTILPNSIVHLLDGGNLYVDAGASLVIGDNVHFIKDIPGSYNKIQIKGTLSACNNVTFDGGTTGQLLEVVPMNNNGSFIFNNCSFTRTAFLGTNGTITIAGCSFSGSYCDIGNTFLSDKLANISNCTFEGNSMAYPAISISNLKRWIVVNNLIEHYQVGFEAHNSGRELSPYFLGTNTIRYCTGSGVRLYNSRATVRSNTITNNNIGIENLDNSTAYIYGICTASSVLQTQQISYNSTYQIKSTNTFPVTFKYNAIENGNYNNRVFNTSTQNYNVAQNYWGLNIGATQMQTILNPYSTATWQPTWAPGGSCGGINIISNTTLKAADSMYQVGTGYNESEDYSMAKSVFTALIHAYPGTGYAQSALFELYYLESQLGEQYGELKNYYENDTTITNDSAMMLSASFLANQCNISVQNYAEAVAWFEHAIEHPVSFNDSIFAIIDLGYTYMMAEADSMKRCPVGRYPEYKPKSHAGFAAYRDYLLGLTENSNTNYGNTNPSNRLGIIKTISPNPVQKDMAVTFQMPYDCNITFTVQNMLGQSITALPTEYFAKGLQTKNLNLGNVTQGIYILTVTGKGNVLGAIKFVVN
jgi:hypothetical protein